MGTKDCPVSNTSWIGMVCNEKTVVAPVKGTLLVVTLFPEPKTAQEREAAFGAAVKVVKCNKTNKLVNTVGNFSRIDFKYYLILSRLGSNYFGDLLITKLGWF